MNWNRPNPLGGVLLLAALVAIALINWVSGGNFFTVAAFTLVAAVAFRVTRKVRRTRRRAAANRDSFPAKPSGGEVRVLATPPGLSQSALHGRLAGIRDAKEAAAAQRRIGHDLSIFFSVEAGVDQRWLSGYREGVSEVLPNAVVEVAYAPQKGSTIL